MRSSLPCAVLTVVLAASGHAQEKARTFCDEADPANKCPGVDCRCAPDTLEVTFDGRSRSTMDAGELEPGATITVTIVLDTKSDRVMGWSYGVAHDQSVLQILDATMDGTDAKLALPGGFDATTMEKIQQCIDDDPRCPTTRDGGGWISATVIELGLALPRQLPRKRNSLAVASYRLLERPGPTGTLIQLSERLKRIGSPPVRIEIITDGRYRRPSALVDGFISPETPPAAGPFLRGDANGDGRINVTDAIGILLAVLSREDLGCEDAHDADDNGNIDFVDGLLLLQFLFDRGPAGSIGICGMDFTGDLLDCSLSSCG